MSNRWLRFGIALLAIGAAGAAGYRIFQQEQRLGADIAMTRAAEQSGESALVTISELKAAMHAYVAEGQGDAFWTARAIAMLDRLRSSLLELDAPATAAGAALADTLDTADRLAAAEQRARQHVREGQMLLAGDVIFSDAPDLLDALRLQVVRTRATILDAATARQTAIRREQATLALAGAGILAFATLLLVIPGSGAPAPTQSLSAARASEPVADEGESSARVIARTPVPPRPASSPRVTPAKAATTPVAPTETSASGSHAPAISLREAAAVCTDLGRVSQSVEISALLERAANVLNASGAIVWMTSPDRHELYPAVSAGYDERLLDRIGSIKRDANNVTAAALRDAMARTSPSAGTSAAALAVPLLTPLGPVGVLSAEIRTVAAVDDTRRAVATIFAAQLASLLGTISTPAADASNESAAAKAQA